jgi:O-antigen/teichoic acid export membrane protein
MEKIKAFLFNNNSLKQTVLKNTFWLTSGTIVSRVIRAILIIYSARILGTEGYGVISYALSLAAFFGIFTDIGLSSLLTRESAKNPEKISAYLSTTFYLKLAILAATVIIMVFASPLFTKTAEAVPLIPIMAVLLVFDSLRTFGFSITRAKNKMEWEAGLSIATDILITALGLATLFIAPHPMQLAYAYTASTGLGFLLVFFVLRNQLKGLLRDFDKELIKPIITKAWPFAIMGLLGGFMINIDTVIIGIFRSANELGLYAAAQRPIQLLYLFPSLVATSIFPILSKLVHENQFGAVKRVIERSIAAVFAIAIPLTVGGIIIARPLIELFFGAEYGGATFTFQLLLITVLLVFPGTIIGNIIFAYDKQRIFIVSTGIGAVTNTVLDLILIPTHGIAGSAVATIISQILVNAINWAYLKKMNDFKILPHVFKISLAAATMGIATFFLLSLGLNIILNLLVSVLIFGGALYLLKEPLLKMINPLELIKE